MSDKVFLENIEFNKDFLPFKEGDKFFFGGEKQVQDLVRFYLKSQGKDESFADRIKINCVLGNNGGGKSRFLALLNSTSSIITKDNPLLEPIVSNSSIFDILSINSEKCFRHKKVIEKYLENNIFKSLFIAFSDNDSFIRGGFSNTQTFFSINDILVNYYKFILEGKANNFKSLIYYSFENKDNYRLIFSINNMDGFFANDIYVNETNVENYLEFMVSITAFLSNILKYIGKNYSDFKSFLDNFSINKEYKFNNIMYDEVYLFIYEILNSNIFGVYFTFWIKLIFKEQKELIKKNEIMYKRFNNIFLEFLSSLKSIFDNKNIGNIINLKYIKNDKINQLIEKLKKLIAKDYGKSNFDFYEDFFETYLDNDFYNKRFYSSKDGEYMFEVLFKTTSRIDSALEKMKEKQYLKYFLCSENKYIGFSTELPTLFSNKLLDKFGYEQEFLLFLKNIIDYTYFLYMIL